MLSAEVVAKYFVDKDIDKKMFNKNLINYNNVSSYEGNIRLNKYLFLAQVVFYGKYEKKLIVDDFVAYVNGPVIVNIMHNYGTERINNSKLIEDELVKDFLDKIYFSLENASCEDLIDISHEDPEWKKIFESKKSDTVMDLEKHVLFYRKKYKGLIEALKI